MYLLMVNLIYSNNKKLKLFLSHFNKPYVVELIELQNKVPVTFKLVQNKVPVTFKVACIVHACNIII